MVSAAYTGQEDRDARARGIATYVEEKYAEALPFLEEAYRLSRREDDEVGTFLGWSLAHTFQLNAAKQLFERILKRAPDAPGAAHGYWFTLKSLGNEVDAIRVAKHEVDRGLTHFLPCLCGTLIETGNIEEAEKHSHGLEKLTVEWPSLSITLNVQQLLGELWSAHDNWKHAALSYRDGIPQKLPPFSPTVKLLRACSYMSKTADLEKTRTFCEGFVKSELALVWSRYQLARFNYCDDAGKLFEHEPEEPIKAPHDFMAYAYFHTNLSSRLWQRNEIERAAKRYKAPTIDPDRLRRNIRDFRSLVEKLIERGAFAVWQHNFKAFQDAFGTKDWSPVFVLSTGRCGTEAFYELMEQSGRVIAHHNLPIRSTPMDRNHLLYRLIEGTFDEAVIERILRDYIESRTAEFLYAVRMKKTVVIANHFDTIFAPFCATLFPDSRFIYMHRDDTATFKSFYGKNQWRNRQLQHWRFDPDFPEGRFVYFQDESLPLEAQIAWYFHLTKVFSRCFFDTLPEHRHVSIESEKLFSKDAAEFDKLRAVLPEGAISADMIRKTYEQPRNAKTAMIHMPRDDIESRSEKIEDYLTLLDETGHLKKL
ncbi:MAG: sulfotransferase [Rhodospirillales bacterium]